MFFSLKLQAGRKYNQEVEDNFQVTMVAFSNQGYNEKSGQRTCVMVKVDEEEETVICSLRPGKLEQQPLNLVFSVGEKVTFWCTGDNAVDLTGMYVTDEGIIDEEGLEYLDDDEEDEDEDDEEELGANSKLEKLMKEEEIGGEDDDEDEDEDDEDEEESEEETPVKPKQQEKKNSKDQKQNQKQDQKKRPAQKQEGSDKKKTKASNEKTLDNGLVIREVEEGTGQVVNKGRKAGVRYVGKLENGKVFDKSSKPFYFKLGAGEVIKGWDLGVAGMKVGGKRRLTIPANLGYGKKGAPPDIPPNATLIFDVELLAVK